MVPVATMAGQKGLSHHYPSQLGVRKGILWTSLARTDAPLFPRGKMKAVRLCWAGRPHEVHVTDPILSLVL